MIEKPKKIENPIGKEFAEGLPDRKKFPQDPETKENPEEKDINNFVKGFNYLVGTPMKRIDYKIYKYHFENVMEIYNRLGKEYINSNLEFENSQENDIEDYLNDFKNNIITVIEIKYLLKSLYPEYKGVHILNIGKNSILDENYLNELKQEYFKKYGKEIDESKFQGDPDEKWLIGILSK